jgi:hypothetical protein
MDQQTFFLHLEGGERWGAAPGFHLFTRLSAPSHPLRNTTLALVPCQRRCLFILMIIKEKP